VNALRMQIDEAGKELASAREEFERQKAREDVLKNQKEALRAHTERVGELIKSAEFFYNTNQFDKATELCDEVIREDPNNEAAFALRAKSRAASHKRAATDNERNSRDMEDNMTLDVRDLAVMPSEDVVYPDDWEQIKRRVRRTRELSSGSEVERQIRDKLENTKISVEYIEQPFRDVLRELQERSRVNIVSDSTVGEDLTVTLTVTDMTIGKVLDWIMQLTDLHYEVKDEAIYVSQQPKRKVILQIYPVYDLTRPMKDYYPPTDGDEEDEFDEEDEDVEDLPFTDIRDRIRNVIPGGWDDDPNVSIDVWEDNLIVMQTPEVHAQIVNYINRLREFSRQQVLVEGRFLDITDDLLEEIGVTWSDGNSGTQYQNANFTNSASGVRNVRRSDGNSIDSGLSIVPQAGAGSVNGLNLSLGYLSTDILDQFEVNAVLNALKEKRRGSVLHNPRLLIANGKNAYLEVETVTNYVSTYTQQGDIFQPEIADYEQGITWSIRPVISYDRKYITIRVRPRLQSFDAANSRTIQMTRVATVGNADEGSIAGLMTFDFFLPVLKLTQLETYATIPDNGTILMGGLIQDGRTESISGVPLLSNIPFIGRLTKSEKRDYSKQNLVIMLHGKIVELD
ncbi:MAG: hypothetical protein JXR97_17155, partial [Planctomycetes bacterium]|nr:hypothetical protein [Planctomycetota bacterium]